MEKEQKTAREQTLRKSLSRGWGKKPKKEQKQVKEPREDNTGKSKESYFQEEVKFKPVFFKKSSFVTSGV